MYVYVYVYVCVYVCVYQDEGRVQRMQVPRWPVYDVMGWVE